MLGLTSSFGYWDNDFVTTVRTPYGVTTFRHEPNTNTSMNVRVVEATDALGATEHLEYQFSTPSLAASAPAGEVPAGFSNWNGGLDAWNTSYSHKRAWAEGPNDLSKATAMQTAFRMFGVLVLGSSAAIGLAVLVLPVGSLLEALVYVALVLIAAGLLAMIGHLNV